ncbi:hypothetical protein G7046_g353 [Stylonectria norvegica]|nr:hypothetical protein G7046_g353 [Stylonectria norvegica]
MKSQLRRHLVPNKLPSTSALQLPPRFPAHPSLSFVNPSRQLTTSTLTKPPFNTPRLGRSVLTASYTPLALRSYLAVTRNTALKSSFLSWNLLCATAGVAVLTAAAFTTFTQISQGSAVDLPDLAEAEGTLETEIMSFPVPPGRPENLTAEQDEKLRKLWHAIFQLCGVADDDIPESAAPSIAATDAEANTADADAPKKKRFGVFRKNHKSGTATPTETSKDAAEEDKYGESKQYYETLAKESPEAIRATIWGMLKHDHPDALVLRFLRARKWDVEKALKMLVSTMAWRHTDMHVDDDIMKNGDAGAIEEEKDSSKQVSKDFLAQLRMGKSFLHGTDKEGRPICVVRVRLHKQGEQCEESLERYTVYTIETCRMVLAHPIDTACVVFDMTGFSMANMDYTPVKFMIKCFEANYPESLGAVLVHKAPWVFQGIWKIIRGWLDPVVASKVHFTNNRSDMEAFIDPRHIIKELDGDEKWEYKYVEPVAGENDLMKDTDTRDKLIVAREELVKKFEHATREWIRAGEGEQGNAIKDQRNKLAAQLKEDYWNLDPYLRARSVYDRYGHIQGGGKTDWYAAAPAPKAAPPNGAPLPETSADDLD